MWIVGSGVFALRNFRKGEFLTEYTGELLSEDEAVERENSYTDDDGSYMFFFKKGKRLLWLVLLGVMFDIIVCIIVGEPSPRPLWILIRALLATDISGEGTSNISAMAVFSLASVARVYTTAVMGRGQPWHCVRWLTICTQTVLNGVHTRCHSYQLNTNK